jgi:hypothetical protein
VCVAVSLCGRARQLVISKLYSATGWDSIYGGSSGSSTNSDAWHDSSGSDDTGARTNILHEDGDLESDSDDTDPDSAKNDVHWNAAGGSTSKTAVSDDDDSADDSASSVQAKMAKASSSSGSGQKAAKATVAAKKGKPDTTDALIKLSQVCATASTQPRALAHKPVGGMSMRTRCMQRVLSYLRQHGIRGHTCPPVTGGREDF